MNGVLPLISILFGVFLFRKLPGFQQLGAGLILVSAVVLAWDTSVCNSGTAWIGDLMFLSQQYFSPPMLSCPSGGSLVPCRSSLRNHRQRGALSAGMGALVAVRPC